MKISRRNIEVGLLVLIGLVMALGLGLRVSFLASDRIAPGVTVAGVAVGGLTEREAQVRLREWAQTRLASNLVIVVDQHRWVGQLCDIGVTVDSKAMARAAYDVGRRGGALAKLAGAMGLTRLARHIPAPYRFDEDKIEPLLEKIRETSMTPAQDARLSFADGVRTITAEIPGTTIESPRSIKLITRAVERGDEMVVLKIVPEQPKITTADLRPVDTLLGRYSTRYPAWRRDRTHNVKLAAKSIDGKLVKPGDILSYNNSVGPRLKETGFKDALVYVKGEMIPGTGGGICQVSSTLYNAALLANLEIVERSNHSMPVPYVPMGRDATVAWGLLDLRFKNTTSAPIYIASKTGGGRLVIEIYGAARDRKQVSLITTSPKEIARANGKTSTVVTVYRVVGNGEKAKRERVSRDSYNPAPPHPTTPATPEKPEKPVQVASR